MKKILATAIICLCISAMVHAQVMTENEARKLFDKSFTYLKNNDSTAFINQWLFDNYTDANNKKPYTRKDVKANFELLRIFLDTALTQNLKIEDIDIYRLTPDSNDTYPIQYEMKVAYKYREGYWKGFGFWAVWVNDKWAYRFQPDYVTTLNRKSDK